MSRRPGSIAAALTVMGFFALTVLANGCRQVLGIDDRQVLSCGSFSPAASCGECLQHNCCGEAAACDDDAACKARFACSLQCAVDDIACQEQCDVKQPYDAAFETTAGCVAAHCAGTCGPSCGGALALPGTLCDPTCAKPCCDSGTAASTNPDYAALLACDAACVTGDVSCREGCVNEHAEGSSLARSLDDCVSTACGDLRRWRCVWPQRRVYE